MTMKQLIPHPILPSPHEYDISSFHYHIDSNDAGQSFIDMTLTRNRQVVTLRFWQPVSLKIEEGFPQPTRGMVFYDHSADGLENITVEVSDFEASPGAVTFFARSVEQLENSAPWERGCTVR
ncbi:hypothetical protein ACFOKJ_07500 [Vogesella amnigena]|uniref:Uncharacterized protein n=1 Tax=Vogesella amnigena TaxID=1507449 RepID=A0ABV7TTB2_9NEIS